MKNDAPLDFRNSSLIYHLEKLGASDDAFFWSGTVEELAAALAGSGALEGRDPTADDLRKFFGDPLYAEYLNDPDEWPVIHADPEADWVRIDDPWSR